METPAADLTDSLAAAGFFVLGGFSPGYGDPIPALKSGKHPRSLLLVGSTGQTLWPLLTSSPEFSDEKPDPLDRYTKRILSAIAIANDLEALFPFEGPPFHPFQQWALACGGFSQSPMGVLAHQRYGPWTGFRAALLSELVVEVAVASKVDGPCETCRDKPCISACPVSALSIENGYDVPKCREHLVSMKNASCWSGCLARRACPIGEDHRQDPANARFHMDCFTDISSTGQ
ncbi:hypothetical protein [uncultured Roseibium sp.]|uniref:hypothetical protein n=1 Tax=uncultured Roseibium sp. TaxID=1936171 RepID=UPI00260F8D9A|nr:hypothetical protein [uncultured Roseibium sp.]